MVLLKTTQLLSNIHIEECPGHGHTIVSVPLRRTARPFQHTGKVSEFGLGAKS